MKHIILLIYFILALFTIKLSSQENLIYKSDFLTNPKDWTSSNNSSITKIQDGKFSFENKDTLISKIFHFEINFDKNKDFSISVKSKFISGSENGFYGFKWGFSNDFQRWFGFGVSANGQYLYAKDISMDSIVYLIDWTDSQFINKYGTNKISIKKKGSIIEFYINDNKVNQYKFENFFNNNFAFAVSRGQKVIFDDFEVNYINEFKNSNEIKPEKRLALVIGNSNYKESRLINPINDAKLIAETLTDSLGFEVIEKIDADFQTIQNAIKEFSKKMRYTDVNLFYYAGHGIQVENTNYIIPVDAELKEKMDCKFEAIKLDEILEELGKYNDKTNIVILDACRDNPFSRSWSKDEENGFRTYDPQKGTIIAFATRSGFTAANGTGKYGLFTKELVKQMLIPQSINYVFIHTRNSVDQLSDGRQTPIEVDGLLNEYYFKKPK
jgi:hypothetical protein